MLLDMDSVEEIYSLCPFEENTFCIVPFKTATLNQPAQVASWGHLEIYHGGNNYTFTQYAFYEYEGVYYRYHNSNGFSNWVHITTDDRIESRLATAESNISSLQITKLNVAEPHISGFLHDDDLTCSNKQIINGHYTSNENRVYVGNPQIDNIIFQEKDISAAESGGGLYLNQLARKTDLTSYIGKSDIVVTSTLQNETVPSGASKGFTTITQTKSGYTALFTILTARSYGDFVTINQTCTCGNGTAVIAGYLGNWHTAQVTVELEMRTIWIKN